MFPGLMSQWIQLRVQARGVGVVDGCGGRGALVVVHELEAVGRAHQDADQHDRRRHEGALRARNDAFRPCVGGRALASDGRTFV